MCCKELILKNIGQLYEQDFSGVRASFAQETTLQMCLMQVRLQALVKELINSIGTPYIREVS